MFVMMISNKKYEFFNVFFPVCKNHDFGQIIFFYFYCLQCVSNDQPKFQ